MLDFYIFFNEIRGGSTDSQIQRSRWFDRVKMKFEVDRKQVEGRG
jgi:hypothetical protein